MATIKDVARRAGVSTSTVSRVLNNGSVSGETAARVREAMVALDYVASTSARGLVQRSANIVGVIVADISNPPVLQLFRGISDRLHPRGLRVMLGNSEADENEVVELLQMFAAQRSRGVIYTGRTISDRLADALNSFPGPVVVGAQRHSALRCPVALFDNRAASMDVVRHMVSAGHRRIAFISGPLEDVQAGEERQHGFIAGLESVGIRIPDSYLQHSEFSMESAYSAMERLMEESERRPTVVYGASDLIALGAIRCAQEMGYDVPGDISVFGFDNIPVGSRLVPSLSTVDLDFYELGEVCADLLSRQLERSTSQLRTVIFRHRIIARESFLPLPKTE